VRQHARLQSAIERSLAGTKYKATGSRILAELLVRPGQTHSQLGEVLGMPQSQVSRATGPMESDGLLKTEPAKKRNQRLLMLSDRGVSVAKEIDAAIDVALENEFKRLTEAEQSNMFIRWDRSGADPNWLNDKSAVKLRPLELTDLNWLLVEMEDAAHKLPYKEEFLLDVLELVVSYMKQPDHGRPPPLAVAHNGPRRLGVCLMRHDPGDAQARIELLHVEPDARRQGIATMLVKKAIDEVTEMTFTRVTVAADERWSGLDLFLRASDFTRSRETREVMQHMFLEQHRDYAFEIGLPT